MAKNRNAHGSGTIRHRGDGLWEARFTYTDDLGQPRRESIYGKTQKECRQKLTAALAQVEKGAYHKGQRYTVGEWIAEWLETYGTTWKPLTARDYKTKSERYILPHIGNVQLSALTPVQVQKFVNKLSRGYKGQAPLAPKSVKNIHGLLHSALKQAVSSGILQSNPADNTKLPKVKKPALKPLMDEDVARFLEAAKGDRFERLFVVDLFSGLRQSELLGLQWPDVDFTAGTLTVRRQLQKQRDGSYIFLDETKNGKDRIVPISPGVVSVLREQKRQQAEWQLAAGAGWSNPHDLVFTDETGNHLKHNTVYNHFKDIVKQIGMEGTRFHDLRHTCAIMALQSGCSVKSVQEMLGHYSSAFTMDVYGAVSEAMMDDTRARMEVLFDAASGGEK